MDAIFFGSAEDAFFDFDSIAKTRTLQYPMMPDVLASKLNNSALLRIPPKQNGEIRILSADIALMASKKHNNDAAAIYINSMSLTKAGRHTCNIVYTETHEGLRTDAQALIIRKLFDDYQCDYLVLDCQGLGLGVYDCLATEMVDPNTGDVYPPLSCCNDPVMAARCTDMSARKVIWSIKASLQFNSDCAFLLREGFRSGRIRLLSTEYDAEELLGKIRGYSSLDDEDKIKLQLPYIETTLLINELVKLEHEEVGGKIRVYEHSGARKDRYSSLSYNYYVATQLETKMRKRAANSLDDMSHFIIKAPSRAGKAVNGRYGGDS